MSIHSSLAISGNDKKQRSVLKRSERIRQMMEKGDWKEGDRVYGLPKIKTVRIRIKKEKVEKVADAAAATAGTTPVEAPPKEQAGVKPAPKAQEKR